MGLLEREAITAASHPFSYLNKSKYSKALNLPREFLKLLGWRQNQNLSVELNKPKKQLIIQDAKS